MNLPIRQQQALHFFKNYGLKVLKTIATVAFLQICFFLVPEVVSMTWLRFRRQSCHRYVLATNPSCSVINCAVTTVRTENKVENLSLQCTDITWTCAWQHPLSIVLQVFVWVQWSSIALSDSLCSQTEELNIDTTAVRANSEGSITVCRAAKLYVNSLKCICSLASFFMLLYILGLLQWGRKICMFPMTNKKCGRIYSGVTDTYASQTRKFLIIFVSCFI